MNPTLSARLRDWQRDPYWRVHPPAPWLVPVEAATALLHQGSVPADSQAADTEPAVPHLAGSRTAGSQTEKAQPAGFQLAVAAPAGTPSADGPPTDDQLTRWQAMADQSVVDQEVVLREAPLSWGAALPRETALSADIEAAPARSQAGAAWPADAAPADRQAALNPGAVTTDDVADRLGTTSSLALAVPRRSGQAAMSTIQTAQVNQLRQLIGVLIFALVNLMEGWQAMRQLFRQIRAIWWTPTTAERAATLQLQPGVPVAIGICGEAPG